MNWYKFSQLEKIDQIDPSKIEIKEDGMYVHLFYDGEKIGGFALAPFVPRAPMNENYAFMSFRIEPDFQNKGFGSILIKYAINKAKKEGAKRIVLNVSSENPAKRLYERFGFKFTGRFQNTEMVLELE